MPRPALAFSALLLLSACGPEPVADSEPEYDEVCGTRGPHRLFAFEPGEWLHSPLGDTRIGDRLYFITGTGETWGGVGPLPETAKVHSTGLCGEDRRFIADDVRNVFQREQLPGVLFGCRGSVSGDLLVLDPAGTNAPQVLIPNGCWLDEWTEHGIVLEVEYEEHTASRLLFYPYPTDVHAGPLEPIVLVDPIEPHRGQLFIDDDEVLALDLDGNLLRIALPDGETTVEQTDVDDFRVSPDGRYLVWEDRLTADDDNKITGKLTLRDRETGVDTVLALAPSSYQPRRVMPTYIELTKLDGGGRVIALPSLETVELPPNRTLRSQIPERGWLLHGEYDAWYLWDPITREETLITTDTGDSLRITADAMQQILHRDPAAPWPAPGELWRYPFDGSAPELLARRVVEPWYLEDGRVYDVPVVDAEGLGDLVLVDPDTLAEQRIDSHVMPPIRGFGWHTPIVEQDTIAYQVLDGERSGIWIVRPAAQ